MLENTINQEKAMVEKATERLSAIRLIKTAIQVEKSKEGKEITDEDVLKIIQRLANQSNDSAAQYAAPI